jgi:hypothetical protein
MWFALSVSEEYVVDLLNEDELITPSLHTENKKRKPRYRFSSLNAMNQFRENKKEQY